VDPKGSTANCHSRKCLRYVPMQQTAWVGWSTTLPHSFSPLTQPHVSWFRSCSLGAPWDKKVKLFDQLGYSADYLKLDTKDYYIPHTRQRGYLFAIRKLPSRKEGQKRLDGRPQQWKTLVEKFKRPASAPLDAYLFSSDDPRVLRGRARLTTASMSADEGNRAGRTDWAKCETRHLAARSNEELGDKRPLTCWSESAKTTMPGFFWTDWFDGQVNRIHDLVDINTLRLARAGVDHLHKTMVRLFR
jgi:site-specific DNA-cytosine methylase